MKILSISDKVSKLLYSPQIRERFPDVDVVLACGDLPYYYVEYISSALCAPTFFVRGNHANVIEYGSGEAKRAPAGAVDLHRRAIECEGILLAGVEGSLRYNRGPFQYTQGEMWEHVFKLAPRLMLNRLQYGRFLDVFATHAPPRGVHDQPDRAHQGIKAFCWLLTVFKPACHFHGHIHVYKPDTVTETMVGKTRVINTYGYRETAFQVRAR